MTAPIVSPRPTLQVQAQASGRGDPCTMIIIGAVGDLSRRKLLPAIYQLMKEHLSHEHFAVLGVARDPLTDDGFRAKMREAKRFTEALATYDAALKLNAAFPEAWMNRGLRCTSTCTSGLSPMQRKLCTSPALITRMSPAPASNSRPSTIHRPRPC